MYALLSVPVRIFRLLVELVSNFVYGLLYESDRETKIPAVRDVVLLDPGIDLMNRHFGQKVFGQNFHPKN
jgi:hypothetical protein